MPEETAFDFDLVLAVPHQEHHHSKIVGDLMRWGCEDGSAAWLSKSILCLNFVRSGAEAEATITSTISRVLHILPRSARLREVRPDLVSLADVARRLKVTRQALQKRDLPHTSLGGLYRATEIEAILEREPGKVRDKLRSARAWFAAAPGAQRINAKISLGTFLKDS